MSTANASADSAAASNQLALPKYVDGDTFIEQAARNQPEWTWHQLMPLTGIVMLAGDPFVGKTVLAVLLGVHSTIGAKLAGREVATGNVLYAKLEHHDSDFADVLRQAKRGVGDPSLASSFFITKSLDLDDTASLAAFKRLAGEVKAEVIVIDSLRRASRMDENSSQDAAEVMRRLQELTGEGNRLVVVLHHLAKNSGSPRGSGDFLAGVDTFVAATKTSGGVSLRAVHHGGGEVEVRLKLSFSEGILTAVDLGGTGGAQVGPDMGKVVELMIQLCSLMDRTRSGLRKALREEAS